MKIAIVSLLCITGLCVVLDNALANSGTGTDMVRGMMNEVMAIQNDPGLQGQENLAAKKAAVKKVILRNFNLDDMIREALGQYYGGLSKATKAEFRSVFQELFLNSYATLVLDFIKEEKISYAGEYERLNQVTVKTVMKRGNGDIPVEYRLIRLGGIYRVKDVSTDGVSMVSNYQNAFSRILKQEGCTGLLKRMRLQQQADDKG